jgi:hypothetical protein
MVSAGGEPGLSPAIGSTGCSSAGTGQGVSCSTGTCTISGRTADAGAAAAAHPAIAAAIAAIAPKDPAQRNARGAKANLERRSKLAGSRSGRSLSPPPLFWGRVRVGVERGSADRVSRRFLEASC